eukprot:7708555-Pyramimonas_sp.AAC.1
MARKLRAACMRAVRITSVDPPPEAWAVTKNQQPHAHEVKIKAGYPLIHDVLMFAGISDAAGSVPYSAADGVSASTQQDPVYSSHHTWRTRVL